LDLAGAIAAVRAHSSPLTKSAWVDSVGPG
jgi:hypothetical protein